MEARPQSEACQDLDSKFTPIRYDEIRHIAGESNARQQINVPTVNEHYFNSSISALDCEIHSEFHPYSTSTSEGSKDSEECDDFLDYPSEVFDDDVITDNMMTIQRITPSETWVPPVMLLHSKASAVRCMNVESTCNFDHSTEGQNFASILFSYLRNVT